MADFITPNLEYTEPEDGGSVNTWGAKLNANIRKQDLDIHARFKRSGDTMSGPLGVVAGTAAAPGVFISGDADTGFYSPGADMVGIATGGAGRFVLSNTLLSLAVGLMVSGSTALAGLTVSGNATLGDAAGDTLTINGTAVSIPNGLNINGNVGFGIPPSTWAVGKAVEVGFVGNALFGATSGQLNLMQNAYFDGTFKYANSGTGASYFQQLNGAYLWYSAATGVAGATISDFAAPKMTLTQVGNLLLNTNSDDGSKFRVFGAVDDTLANFRQSNNGQELRVITKAAGIYLNAANGAENLIISRGGLVETARFTILNNFLLGTQTDNGNRIAASGGSNGMVADFINTATNGSYITITQSEVANWAIGQPAGANALAIVSGRNTALAGLEVARFFPTGNLSIGTTIDGGARLYAFGNTNNLARVSAASNTVGVNPSIRMQNGAAYDIQHITGGGVRFVQVDVAEHGRFNAAGDLYIGTAADLGGLAKHQVNQDSTGRSGSLVKNLTAANDTSIVWNADTAANNVLVGFYTEASITSRGSIDYNRAGGLVRYNTTSDQTLKTLIGDAPQEKSLTILRETRLREFYWNDDPDQKPQITPFAQELHQTFPGAVSVGGWYDEVVPALTEQVLVSEGVQEVQDAEGNVLIPSEQPVYETVVITPEHTVQKYRPWGVDKTAFSFHLVAGFQYHDQRIAELEARLEALEMAA